MTGSYENKISASGFGQTGADLFVIRLSNWQVWDLRQPATADLSFRDLVAQ